MTADLIAFAATLSHAEYVNQVDRLRAALEIVVGLDVAKLRAHHDKLRALAPLDPAAWAKHGKRIQDELFLIAAAERVVELFPYPPVRDRAAPPAVPASLPD
jgi:hypothetical protein